MLSLLFSRDHQAIAVHQDLFWKTYNLGRFSSFNEFHENFPGLIMDFSEGQLRATFETLSRHVESYYHHALQRKEFETMIRFCSVHFKRNLARVARNGRIITNSTESEFKAEVLKQFDFQLGEIDQFLECASSLLGKYPLASGFLLWYLHPNVSTIAARTLSQKILFFSTGKIYQIRPTHKKMSENKSKRHGPPKPKKSHFQTSFLTFVAIFIYTPKIGCQSCMVTVPNLGNLQSEVEESIPQ